ncbi:MAG: RND family transporter [Bacteroidales bacterium]|nr:RND family transporter [Bacteroidales bacterium]
MKKFTEKILAFRWLIITIVLMATAVAGYQVTNLRIDADILRSLPDNDPDAALLKRIGDNFGGNNMGIIILETDDVYQTSVLEHVKAITESVGEIGGITSVTSLTNIINIKSQDHGFEIGRLVDEYELPETEEDFELLKANVWGNEMYRGSIVSEDGTATLIIFTLSPEADVRTVASTVIEKTQALHIPEKLYYIGSPMLVSYISDLMRGDLIRLLPIAFILIAVILLLSFRSVEGVVMPLMTAVIAIVWSMGIMGLLNYKMSMISNNIPIILLAVGSAYTIHVLNRINQLRITDRDTAIRKALEYVMIPVLLAAATTIVGFISFIFGAYLEMIVDFGIFTALGTFFACLLSVFFVPALLDVTISKKRDKENLNKIVRKSFLSDNFLSPIKSVLLKHPKYVLTTWSVLIVVSIIGIFFIKRSVDIQDYFKKGNPTREAERIMVEKFGGTKPVFVLFEGDMQDPEVLKTMYETGDYMEQSPDIYTTQSLADLILQLNEAISGEREIPDDQEKIEQLWFLLDGNEVLQRFVNEDLTEGIIISKFKSPDNKSKQVFAEYMNTFIGQNSRDDCRISITGMPFVDITMDRSLINSQVGSITLAIIFVILLVAIILRSFLSGIFSAIPIIAAISVLFGVMGLTGIPLNIATVLVASVALGIGIDYSIHIISHFNHTLKITGDARVAIEETIMISGKAIIINVVSVSAGFLILVFSDMVPLQYFGFLIALSMVGSSLGALTLLPVILILAYRNKKV